MLVSTHFPDIHISNYSDILFKDLQAWMSTAHIQWGNHTDHESKCILWGFWILPRASGTAELHSMLSFQIRDLRKTKHALIYISVCGTPYLGLNFSVSIIHSGRALFTNWELGNALSNSYTINSVLSKDCRMHTLQRLRITYHSESHKIPILALFPKSLVRTQDQKRNIYCKWLLVL